MLGSYTYSRKTSSALIKTGPGGVHSIVLAAGSDTATLIIYDSTAGSGTVICELSAVANTSESAVLDVTISTGLYMALTGTAPSGMVSYW